MMRKYDIKKENIIDIFAVTLSVIAHGMLLLGIYYMPLHQSGGSSIASYEIELDIYSFQEKTSIPSQEIVAYRTEQVASPVIEEDFTETFVPLENINSEVHEQINQELFSQDVNEKNERLPLQSDQKNEKPTIDNRSLYHYSENKKMGASLSLIGWTWDNMPHPKDSTNEVGKIVFEIIIDDLGEIIAINTLEKTVSPLVEQLYKEEVAKLTFSKIDSNMSYASKCTGKITFIIQYQ